MASHGLERQVSSSSVQPISKHDHWSSDPQNPHKCQLPACSSSSRKQRQEISRASWLTRTVISESSRFDWETLLQWMWKGHEGWLLTSTCSGFHIQLHTHHKPTHENRIYRYSKYTLCIFCISINCIYIIFYEEWSDVGKAAPLFP